MHTGKVVVMPINSDGRAKGFGFLDVDDRPDLGRCFFHARGCDDFEDLGIGDSVSFELSTGSPRGPRASGVRRLW